MTDELASEYTRGKRARDSMNEGDYRTAALAKRTRSTAFGLNETDSPEHHARIYLSHEDYTVGWVCALPSEMAAAKSMLDIVHKPLPMNPNDTNHYVFGSINHHNIVIVCLPSGQYGITRAAIVANNMRWSFPSIYIRLMVGIGGGVPGKVDMRLGDVVVSIPTLSSPGVIQYDFGKTVNSGRFQVTGFLNKPPQDILGAVAKLRADHESQSSSIPSILSGMIWRNPAMSAYTYRGNEQDRLYAATYDHVGESCDRCDPTKLVYRNARPDNNPRIHYGTIASANQVMKHGLTRDRLAKEYDILCFEMEAAGLMDHFPCLVIRGICDYSDSHKAKQWQEYAAATAAAYAKELLSVIPRVQGMQVFPSKPSSIEASSTSPTERRLQLMDSLRFGQIDSRYESIKAAHAKTCHWLLGHSDYLCWLDPNKMADHHGFLWISGKPGTGKSTIMKYAFSQATKNATPESAVISFFFNARGDYLERTIEGMYRSLLLQLLEKFPKLQVVLDDVVAASFVHSGSGQFNISLVQDLVLKAIAKLGRQEVTCFVDALDECDEKEVGDMLDFFVDLGHCAVQRDTKLYICFSSRHYPYMDIPHCQRFTLEDQMGHKEDIEVYVQNKLQTGNKKQSGEIKAQVLQKASGVFMWVVLVVDILNKEYKRGRIFAVKERLDEIPPGLSELFRDILTRDKENMEDFLLCIQWLLFGSRPLKREEYYFAMATGLRSETPDSWDEDTITKEDMNLFVLSSSKGLVETATKSKKAIVQFIHESVRDFLLKDGGLKSLWPDLGNNFAENSHEQLKKCCYTYLQADLSDYLAENNYYLEHAAPEKVTSLRREISDKFPFMEYAATQLFYHAEAAAGSITQEEFLRDVSVIILGSWTLRRNLFVSKNSRLSLKASFLHFLVEQQYVSLIKITIGSIFLFHNPALVSLNTKDNFLSKAIKTGNGVAARAILQSLKGYRDRQGSMLPSDPNIARQVDLVITHPDRNHRTPLSYAVEKGLVDVAKLLLDVGAGVGESDKMPLLFNAIEKGHAGIVELLFSWDSGFLHNGDYFELPPSSAIAPDRPSSDMVSPTTNLETATVSMALHGVKTSSNMQFDHAVITEAFWRAVIHAQDDIAEILFKKGAKTHPSSYVVGFRPVIHAAIHSGLESLTQLLLDKNEDIKTVDAKGLTALHIASGHSKLLLPSSAERIARVLITQGADVEACDNHGKRPLHLACGNRTWRESSVVAESLIESGADVNALDNNRNSPLHAACEVGNEVTVELLVQKGADIRAPNSDGVPPLHLNVQAGNQTIVEILLRKGVDPKEPDQHGKSPLQLACQLPIPGIARAIIEKSADLQIIDEDGRSLLHLACQFQNLQTAEMLTERGAAVGVLDKHGKSPLHVACQSDKPALLAFQDDVSKTHELLKYGTKPDLEALTRDVPEIIEMLLMHGAVLNCKDNIGETPLFYAVRWSTGPIFNLLLKLGADIFATDAWGQTALFVLPIAGRQSQLYLADKGALLLQEGLDPMHRDNLGQTFLHVACQSRVVDTRYLDFVREAIKSGLDVDARDDSGRTPLMNAAKVRNEAFISFLLKLKVDINKVDDDGRTPLTEAIRTVGRWSISGRTIIDYLLENGAKPHAPPGARYIPLFVAVENASPSVVQRLLNTGVDIGMKDAMGRSSMFFLPQLHVGNGETEVDLFSTINMVQCLLRKGANINHRDTTGQTVLHHAAQRRADWGMGARARFYRTLVQYGIEVDAQDQAGKTALLCAVSSGNSLAMDHLLRLGANPNLGDNRGQTPLCERIAGRMSDVLPDVRLLLKHGAAVGAVGMNGETPLDLATRLGNRELVELLHSCLDLFNSLFGGEHGD
ncbi:ankyrin repeat-containing domain protein [Colletotrichum cereale]|nr:ankyrin repeat-containing domain protein [Colletotrichum cereale]